jgi:hypothetical protein
MDRHQKTLEVKAWYNKNMSPTNFSTEATVLPIRIDGDKLGYALDGNRSELYFVGDGNTPEKPDTQYRIEIQDLTDDEGFLGTQKDTLLWDAANNPDWEKEEFVDVKNWTNIVIVSANAFEGCSNLIGFSAANSPVLSAPDSAVNMFKDASVFNATLEDWDFSNVLEADGMFSNCDSLTDENLRENLYQMYITKSDKVTPSNPMYIDVDITTGDRKTTYYPLLALTDAMKNEGQIVRGLTNNYFVLNTSVLAGESVLG